MPQPVTTSSRKRPGRSPALPIAIAAIAIVAAAVSFLLRKGGAGTPCEPPPQAAGPAKAAPSAAPVEPRDAPSPDAGQTLTLQPFDPSTNVAAAASALATNAYVKKPGQMMLPGGEVITFKPPVPGETRRVFALNRIYECDSEGNWEDITPKKLFDNPIENGIVNLALANKSFIPAFMTGYDTNAVMEALRKDVIINEDDTPDIVAKKEAVAEMKGQILDYINQGGTYDGFIMEMATYVKAERKIKGRALSKISKLLKEGRIEEACAYRDEINKVLDDQQYSTLKLPKFMSDAMGE